jgi:putative hydrolase of the HAD superfamily
MFTKSLREGIEGIVFDAVGTLIEPDPSVADVYLRAACRQGVALDPVEVRARFRLYFRNDEVDESLGPMATDEALEYRRWRRIVSSVLPEVSDIDRAFSELWSHFARPEAWRCFDDVGQTVQALRAAGIPLRIASNFDGRLHAVVAGLPAIAPLRDSLVISSEVGFRKPHFAFYRAACNSLGVPAEGVLYVGDDPANDLRGPRQAGLRSVLVDRSGAHPGETPSVPDLMALLAALGV